MTERLGLVQFFDLVLTQQEVLEGISDEELLQKLQAEALADVARLELLADAVPGGNADSWALERARIRAATIVIARLDWETPWYGPFPPERKAGNCGGEEG